MPKNHSTDCSDRNMKDTYVAAINPSKYGYIAKLDTFQISFERNSASVTLGIPVLPSEADLKRSYETQCRFQRYGDPDYISPDYEVFCAEFSWRSISQSGELITYKNGLGVESQTARFNEHVIRIVQSRYKQRLEYARYCFEQKHEYGQIPVTDELLAHLIERMNLRKHSSYESSWL